MNIYSIPILGWIIGVVLHASLAIPFWLAWTVCGLGAKYFYFLPEVYQNVPFWNCVGLFVVVSILKTVLLPRTFNIIQENKGNK